MLKIPVGHGCTFDGLKAFWTALFIFRVMAEWKCVYKMFINFSFYSSSKLYLLGPVNLPDPITCFKIVSSLLQFEYFPLSLNI